MAPGRTSIRARRSRPSDIRRARTSKALAARSAELAFAVPQVIAHRMLQMDRKEFHTMGAEKFLAFGQSWNAMAMQTMVENQRLALSAMQAFWFPWLPRPSASKQLERAALGIAGAGLAPIHRSAVANSKRLRKRRLRAVR
jgi:hypothetical protein